MAKDFDLAVSGGDPLDIGLINSADFKVKEDDRWNELSYSLSIEHHLWEDFMLYGRVATGFKSGSFNSLAISPASARASSEPESAVNTELGWKGLFWNRALQLNGAIFQVDYDDLQVYSGLESGTNAPQARISGAELDLRAKLTQGLELAGNYTYLDTEYEHFQSPATAQDFSGNRLTRAPAHELALQLNYSWTGAESTRYRLEWDANHTSEYAIVPGGSSGDTVPDRTVSNIALYVNPPGGKGVMALWVRNLFNEHYPVHAFGQEVFTYTPEGSAWNLAEPRTLGISMSWSH